MVLYPLAFLTAVTSLSLWFFVKEKKPWASLLPMLFYAAFATWGMSLFFADGAMATKLPSAFRDLILMGGVPMVLQLFSKSKPLFFAALLGLIGLYYGFGWDIWEEGLKTNKQNIEQITEVKNQDLDTRFELLAEIKNGSQLSDLQSITQKYELTYQQAFEPQDREATELDDYVIINIPTEKTGLQAEIEKALMESGLIDWLEENEEIKIDDPTADLNTLRSINTNYGVNDPDLDKQWALAAMNVDKLYDFLRNTSTKPKRKARVFILDTGVDAQHEDLSERYQSVQTKYDNDPQGHGTHCAGIAGATTNNGVGGASLTPTNDYIELSSIKVLGAMGSGSQKMIISGILEAADNNADVISLSLGGRSTDSKQRAYRQAIEYANKKGAIVVAAAGNSNSNAKNFAPAGAKGIICVSAVDENLNRAKFSNYVQDISLGIAAPGVNIFSTIPENNYKNFSGTSMATPYVAGLIGLMKSFNPDLTTKEAFSILKKTGMETKSGKETGVFVQPHLALRDLLDK